MSEILRWEQGRAVVDALLADGRMERVTPNRQHAGHLLARARATLESASAVAATDTPTAFALTYDAGRYALMAIFAAQGLRARSGEGSHSILIEVVAAQLDPPFGPVLRRIDWMRRLRNSTVYPSSDGAEASPDDLADATPAAERVVEIAADLVDVLPIY